jgi:hypothetical protein
MIILEKKIFAPPSSPPRKDLTAVVAVMGPNRKEKGGPLPWFRHQALAVLIV